MLSRRSFLFLLVIIILVILVLLIWIKKRSINKEDLVLYKKKLPSRYRQRIPFLIMTTHEFTACDENLSALIKLNPEYHVYFFDHASRRTWLDDHYSPEVLRAYDDIVPGAYKADLFRYCFLFKKGGVYLDINKKLVTPMRVFIHPRATMGLVLNSNHTSTEQPKIINGFLYIVQGHPLMKEMVDRCVRNIQNKVYGDSPLSVTGPYLFGAVFKEMMGKSLYSLGTGVHYIMHEVVHVMIYREKESIEDPFSQTSVMSFNNVQNNCMTVSAPPVLAYPIFWKERKIYR